MSAPTGTITGPTTQLADVIDLRPYLGELRADGRRKGDTGHRASSGMKTSVMVELLGYLTRGAGVVPAAVIDSCADRAGVSRRQVQRWAAALRAELTEHLAANLDLPDDAEGDPVGSLIDGGPGRPDRTSLPEHIRQEIIQAAARIPNTHPNPVLLARPSSRGALELTEDEMRFIFSHPTVQAAFDVIHVDPSHRLSRCSRATLYRVISRIPEQTRVGLRKGRRAALALEMGAPLSGGQKVNDIWTVDEYDLKVHAVDTRGVNCNPKLLALRENASSQLVAWMVVLEAANSDDLLRLAAAATLGFTRTLPDGRQLTVQGAARLLRADQGSALISEMAQRGLGELGISLEANASYSPRSNGAHEQMHRQIAVKFTGGPGSRRGAPVRDGSARDHGVLPLDEVIALVTEIVQEVNDHTVTRGVGKGTSPAGRYLDLVQAGHVWQTQVSDADIARALPVFTERKVDKTRGFHVNNRYYCSAEINTVTVSGISYQLRQALNPDVLYVMDRAGKQYLGVVYSPNVWPDADKDRMYRDRAERERVSEGALDGYALAARQSATAAQARHASNEFQPSSVTAELTVAESGVDIGSETGSDTPKARTRARQRSRTAPLATPEPSAADLADFLTPSDPA